MSKILLLLLLLHLLQLCVGICKNITACVAKLQYQFTKSHLFVAGEYNSDGIFQLYDCTCVGYTQTYKCTALGGGITTWRGSAFDCLPNEIRLRHSEFIVNPQLAAGECNDKEIVARGVGASGNCYTSQLNVNVSLEMKNETIECIHYDIYRNTTEVGHKVVEITTGIIDPFPALRQNREGGQKWALFRVPPQ